MMIGPEAQLRRIRWLMLPVGGAGITAWAVFRSLPAACAFGLGALASWALWLLHVLLVKRMLTPGNPGRAGYVLLSTGKLALIGLALAGIMERYPEEGIPFATGLLLSVGAILLEAVILAFHKAEPAPPGPPEDSAEDSDRP
ncbi:MAG TPA: hypothetical protein VFF76_00895 [Holophagaceae bacterium]|jgi:hypothetical protein|nr:hypothetical protein [Holophagaceae bacterium]